MQLPYVFAASPEQVAQRRELLDTYARLAQTSILLPFLALYLFKALHQTSQRDGKDAHESEAKRWMRSSQRVAWWLGEEIAKGWNTRGEFLLVGSWGIWLAFCILAGTENGDSSL